MKLCRFDGGYGLISGDSVVDITALVGADTNTADGDPLIRALPKLAALEARDLGTRERRPLAGLTLLSPIARPSKILAAPNNYHAHLAEMKDSAVAFGRLGNLHESGFFLKATSSLVGPSEGIAQRFLDRRTDHELELVAVIGKAGTAFSRESAMDHVAGYCLGLDITLRGQEERSLRKSIDSYTVLGPWLVTADELSDLAAIEMSLSLNGSMRQKTSLSDMICEVDELVEYAGRFYTLHPGDLIYTGTPSGVGPIRPGDTILAPAAGLGTMEVRVRDAGLTGSSP